MALTIQEFTYFDNTNFIVRELVYLDFIINMTSRNCVFIHYFSCINYPADIEAKEEI